MVYEIRPSKMIYHLQKSSRLYTGRPYCGSSSDNIPAIAYTLEEAIALKAALDQRNMVGFTIYEVRTHEGESHAQENHFDS